MTHLAQDGVSGQRHAPVGKDPRYPFDRRPGGPQSLSGHRGYRENPLASAGESNLGLPGRRVRSQTLFWLSYPGCMCVLLKLILCIDVLFGVNTGLHSEYWNSE
jgi:hypothetical protein